MNGITDTLSSPVGLIAGNGVFPLEFAESARAKGLKVVAVGHLGETFPSLSEMVDKCIWVKVGELGKIIKYFKKSGVKQVAFAGGIKRVRLLGGVKLDFRALKIARHIRSLRDDSLLRAVAGEIESSGLEVISASVLLEKSVPAAGLLTKRDLSVSERKDAVLGWEVAKTLGALDTGQTAIVLDGLILALETVEGTDATIKRAGELMRQGKKQGAVVVKVSKPQQDLRIDLPAVGENTMHEMKTAGCSALIIEAQKTLLLNPTEVCGLANKFGIAIIAVDGAEGLRSLESSALG